MACELLQESITPEGSLIDEVVEESLVSRFEPMWREGGITRVSLLRLVRAGDSGRRRVSSHRRMTLPNSLIPAPLSLDVLFQQGRPGRAVAAPSPVARGEIHGCERRGDPTVERVAAEVHRPVPIATRQG